MVWSPVATTAAPQEAVGGGFQEAASKEEEALLPPAMVPIAGHALVMWGESILCIGGHTKVCRLSLLECNHQQEIEQSKDNRLRKNAEQPLSKNYV